jgi:hypothetical protein
MSKLINLYETKAVKKFIKTKNSPEYSKTKINYRDRVMICGGSGTGKTHALVNYLILSPNCFHKVIVVSKNIEEPLYEFLKDKLKERIVFYDLSRFPTMNQLAKEHREQDEDELLIIYDDIVNDIARGNTAIENMFIAGRKLGFTQFFLTQSYYRVPKVIRLQLTHLMLLKLSSNNDLNMILRDFALGVEKSDLTELYKDATSERMHFLFIDINSTDPNMKFSKDFNNFYKIEE